MGRSRGGLTTKIHATVNEYGMPLKFTLTPSQDHDVTSAKTLLANLQPGQYVLGDKAYDADWVREMIWEQGAIAVIPSKAGRKCPKKMDKEIYKERNRVERFFGRLKISCRRIATRYEKKASNFLAMVKLGAIRIWCDFYESAT